MSNIETFTPKQILSEIIPAKYGQLEGDIMFVFHGHVLDGSVVAVINKDEVLLTCRIRFTNDVILSENKELLCLNCKLSHMVFVKPPTVKTVETEIIEPKVEPIEDNIPHKPAKAETAKPAKQGAGRGRGRGK